jgi:signal peptidase II
MQTPGRKGLAVTDRRSHLRLWLTVGLGVGLDLVSKYAAWGLLGGPPDEGGRAVTAIPGWLQFVASRNPGIVFGLSFAGSLGPEAGRVATIAMTLATSALIFYVFASSLARQRWIHLWCGLILAGALGNLFDRLVFGYVRDLIQITAAFHIAGCAIDWPYIFNVADVYLVLGVIAVAGTFLFGPKSGRQVGEARRTREES